MTKQNKPSFRLPEHALLLIVLWLAAAACRPTAPTWQATPTTTPAPTATPLPAMRTVKVTVRDAQSAQPIANAVLTIDERRVQTDASGGATVEVPFGTRYIARISAPGYEAGKGQVDAALPGTQVLELETELEPTRLPGQVFGLNGASLLGLRGIVVKSHGSADAFAFEVAVNRAWEEASQGILERISAYLPPMDETAPRAQEMG